MDRGGTRRHALIVSALALLLLGAGPGTSIPIREARWLAPAAAFDGLTREPAECVLWPNQLAARRDVAIGRIAFRAPLLLGGQAARAGMSCASCHRNGRGNPDFHFPGLSGAPGTADVTSSLMSSRRGDRLFNPRPIPDLAGPPSAVKISRRPGDDNLRIFIRGLIVEEFDGPEPSPQILEGLVAYVRAMRPDACPEGTERINLRGRLQLVDEAVSLARAGDGEGRRQLLAAARSTLGSIDERFQLSGLEQQRKALRRIDALLAAIAAERAPFARWREQWPAVRSALLRAEHRSLYAPARLRLALRTPVPAMVNAP